MNRSVISPAFPCAFIEEGTKSKQNCFTFIDLFAGIGGMRRGFEPLGGKCVFTSEWNPYAQQTYQANFVCNHPMAGDITQIHAQEIPPHDLLLAGFPCQPFSIAGVSAKKALHQPHGFHCRQGMLFFELCRIIEYHRPKVFLLENVKNLVSHDKGHTFKMMCKTLMQGLGYQIFSKIIDARLWVPQHRERVFIMGLREPNSFSFDMLLLPDSTKNPKLGDILHDEGKQEFNPHDWRYLDDKKRKVHDRYTLSDRLWGYLQAHARKHHQKGNGFGFGLVGVDDISRTLSARYYKDGSEILVCQNDKKNPRRLTPRECARLMGFDRPGESKFVIPVSDTQAYKQFGNAVVVPLIEAIGKHILPYILPNTKNDKGYCHAL